MKRTADEVEKLIEKHKSLINNPYWIYNKKSREKLIKYEDIIKSGEIPVETAKNIFSDIFLNDTGKVSIEVNSISSSLYVNLATGIASVVISYAVSQFFNYVEDKLSARIVKLYLLASLLFDFEENDQGDTIDVIDCIAFDLLAMSTIRYSVLARRDIKSSLWEATKSMFGKQSFEYIYRQNKFICYKVKNRLLAFLFNVSIIHNIENNERFIEIMNKYLFNSIHDLENICSPQKSAHYVQISELMDPNWSYKKKNRSFVDEMKKAYNHISTEIVEEIAEID